MKKRKPSIGPVERAVLLSKWRNFAVSSQINVLIGDCSPHLVNYAGRMMYVALGCAMVTRIPSDDLDVRILRGAVNALHDQVGLEDIANRPALIVGVEAALRISDRVGTKVLNDEICKMELRLRVEHIDFSDFLEMVA